MTILPAGFLQFPSHWAERLSKHSYQYSVAWACAVKDCPQCFWRGPDHGKFFLSITELLTAIWRKCLSNTRTTQLLDVWLIVLIPLPQPLTTPGSQEYKMPTSRCVRLMLIGMANSVKEMWIGQQPFLMYFYLWQYTPTLAWLISSILGRRRMQNFKAGLVCLLSFWKPCDLSYHEAYSALVY